jgi:hypothetical protein
MRLSLSITLSFFTAISVAQSGKDVVNEQINITKEKEVEINKANKVQDKGKVLESTAKDKKMVYTFYDKKISGISEVKFEPSVVSPEDSKNKKTEEESGFNNYAKLGLGNFGRIYGEGFINSNQNNAFIYGISAFHNSTRRGPIKNDFSALSNSKFQFDGKYHLKNFELKGDASYENRQYYFYGYDTLTHSDYTRDLLKQKLNILNFNTVFENTNPKPKVDFQIKTGINHLDDNYSASELDWASTFKFFFPIVEDKIIATLNAETYITEISDNFIDTETSTRKRNLYRVEPGFSFDFGNFSTKIGFKAVNQYDQILKVNETKGFPTALISYKTSSLTYFFAGYDGDIIRNTLQSLINENPFLGPQLNIQNTYKNSDIYIGARGDLYSGLAFNAKISYGKYQNLYFYNAFDGIGYAPNAQPISTTKFILDYEETGSKTDFVSVNYEMAYNIFDYWKSNIKIDYNYFETIRFNKAYHRPAFNGRLGNIFTFSNKMVASLDFYYLNGIYAREPQFGDAIKLKDIYDLNAEITYLFTKQFSTFVKINNIVGKNYQRYYNYPQLGLNFVAGLNVSL